MHPKSKKTIAIDTGLLSYAFIKLGDNLTNNNRDTYTRWHLKLDVKHITLSASMPSGLNKAILDSRLFPGVQPTRVVGLRQNLVRINTAYDTRMRVTPSTTACMARLPWPFITAQNGAIIFLAVTCIGPRTEGTKRTLAASGRIFSINHSHVRINVDNKMWQTKAVATTDNRQ